MSKTKRIELYCIVENDGTVSVSAEVYCEKKGIVKYGLVNSEPITKAIKEESITMTCIGNDSKETKLLTLIANALKELVNG